MNKEQRLQPKTAESAAYIVGLMIPDSATENSEKEEGGCESGMEQPSSDVVPVTGLEPVRFLGRGILSPLCLPIPPYRHGAQL